MEGAKVVAEAMEEVKEAMEAAAVTQVLVVGVAMEVVMAADMVLEAMMADMEEVPLTAEAVVEVDMMVEEGSDQNEAQSSRFPRYSIAIHFTLEKGRQLKICLRFPTGYWKLKVILRLDLFPAFNQDNCLKSSSYTTIPSTPYIILLS